MTNANPFAAFQQQAAQPQQPAAVQPQGFGAPVQPQGQAFGVPPQQQVQQQPVAVQPQGFGAAAAPVQQGFGALPDMSQIGESSGREPNIPAGAHVMLFKSNAVKTRQGHTAIALFTVEQTNNNQYAPGAVWSFLKKLPVEQDKKAKAIGFALGMIRAMAGYSDEATFKREIPYWSQLLAAFIFGDPKFTEWATGRRVAVVGVQGDPILEKGVPTGKHFVNYEWFAAPPKAA
jgi:hypothetical protein